MSESLVQKYRPIRFEDILGQDINNRLLSNFIKLGYIGKNIILHGPFGASKTSSARIYARALNCLKATNSGSPCNECEHCVQFFNNSYSDFIEVDGATQGKKDKIQDLIEIISSPPILGRYRVIIIDECQNLSRSAWDTLLKITEEPPSYLVFIFTTTEYNKVPKTIQSRCHSRQVSLLQDELAKNHLVDICTKENIPYENAALEIIISISKGHARDLLKNLEQCFLFGGVTEENALQLFNLGYIQHIEGIVFQLLSGGDISPIFLILDNWGEDATRVLGILNSFVIYIYMLKCRNIKLNVDPIFHSIPSKDIEIIFGVAKELSSSLRIDVDSLFDRILELFKGVNVGSNLELYSFIIGSFNSIHRISLKLSEDNSFIGVGSMVDNKIDTSNVKGRKFIDGFESKNKTISNSQTSSKLYTHSLTAHNFKFKDKEHMKIGRI